jgi:hypothetical protein
VKCGSIGPLTSPLLGERCAATCFLTMLHTGLSGVVGSGICGGHDNDAGDVCEPRPSQRLGKCSFKMSRTVRSKCAVAPPCCTHSSTVPSGINNFFNISAQDAALTGPSKMQGPIKRIAVIPAQNTTYGELRSNSNVKCGFSLAQNTFLSWVLGRIVQSSVKRTFKRDAVFCKVPSSARPTPQFRFLSTSDSL